MTDIASPRFRAAGHAPDLPLPAQPPDAQATVPVAYIRSLGTP
jgi:hypothetical protein